MTELDKLLQDLLRPGIAYEVLVLVGCVLVAFGLCWLVGRKQPKDSVWFGRRVVDGVLFPALALLLVYGARRLLIGTLPGAVLKIAVPVLISLAVIRLLARVLTAVFPQSGAARLLERLFSWMAWIAAVLWIVGLLPAVMEEMDGIKLVFGKSHISLLTIVQGTLSSGLVLVLVLWISAALEKRILTQSVSDLSLRKITANAIRSVLLLLGLLFALSAVGVDLTALSVLGGALGVGLGFGLQKLAANYVSGFVILLERSLRIGDTVKVDNFEGTVVDIKTRYTLIRNNNGRESIVPNEKLITERIENLSLADPRVLLTTNVSVSYESDVALVQELLVKSALASERVLKDPAPSPKLASFGADGLEFQLLFWINDPQNGDLNLRSEINLRILQEFKAVGIDIPYPQRVLHVRSLPAGMGAVTPAGPAGAAAAS